MPGHLLLVDAANLYFRAFYGVPRSVQAPDGSPVNAVRGFLDMLASVVESTHPAAAVVCLDADWRPAFRVAALPSYKAHRLAPNGAEDVPDELGPQVPILLEVLAAAGLAACGASGYEADDVIGTFATRADRPVDLLTGDRDMFQLVRDTSASGPAIRVLYTARGVRAMETVDEAWITGHYNIPGRSYADFAVLRGDPSDGLPGVPGVGDKSAAALISRFGSLAGVQAAIAAGVEDGFPAGARRRVAAATDYLQVAPSVVRVVCDIEDPAIDAVGAAALPRTPVDAEALRELGRRYGIARSVARLGAALTAANAAQLTAE